MRRGTSPMQLAAKGIATVAEEKPPRLTSRELRLLAPYVRPYLGVALTAAFLMITAAALKLAGPFWLRAAIDNGIATGEAGKINLYGGLFVVSVIGVFLALRFSTAMAGVVGEKVLRDLRISAFKHLSSLSLGFFERERSGRLVARVTSDIEAAERFVTDSMVRISTELLFVAGAGVAIFVLDWRLAFVAISVVPLMVVGTIAFRRRSKRAYEQVRERVASVLSYLQETLRGVHVVQAFASERTRSRGFRTVNEDWEAANIGAFTLEAYYFPSMEFLGWVGTGGVVLFGGLMVLDDQLTLGVLAAFVVYLNTFFDPIHHLSELYMTFQSAMAGLARVAQLLDTEPDIIEAADGARLELSGKISMNEVTFSYRPGAPKALEKINLEIEPGETVALVGPTGAGKSTIVKLLARFYDVVDGSIELEGVDLRKIQTQSFRSQIALVPQEGFLFGGDILENIRFGRPEASEEEVVEACKAMGIDDFISSLPEAYRTDVRERGARLSAGERQLIALARAVISRPRLILLDEATSSLDSSTEARIDEAFRRALAGRTCVLIAHRLSTAMRADRIVVVEEGKIAESGSHQELLAKGGRYAELYRYWLAGAAEGGDGRVTPAQAPA